jgi:hypothetical protein
MFCSSGSIYCEKSKHNRKEFSTYGTFLSVVNYVQLDFFYYFYN